MVILIAYNDIKRHTPEHLLSLRIRQTKSPHYIKCLFVREGTWHTIIIVRYST